MALASSTVLEIRTGGNSANGGGFNVGNANFATDLAATSGTGAAPVVSSASYTFVAGDVGASVFVKSGTNWTPGFYPIASVSGGAATLTATIGSVNLYGGATVLNTAAGVATTASPTAGTWGVDYSQQTSPQFTFTDMVIDGTTATKFTSAANPVGKNFVGNLINVTSGTGFTVQRVEVVSTSTTTATCDKSLGTLSSTGGNGKLGGCLDGPGTASGFYVYGNPIFWKTGAYTTTATITFSVAGTPGAATPPARIIGYNSYRGDTVYGVNAANRPTLTLSTNTGLTALLLSGSGTWIDNVIVDCASLGTSDGIRLGGNYCRARNCTVKNFTSRGLYGSIGLIEFVACEATLGTSTATGRVVITGNSSRVHECNIHDNACVGIASNVTTISIMNNLVTNNTGASSDGITWNNDGQIEGNTVHASGRHGIVSLNGNSIINVSVRGNLLTSNGGFGLKLSSSAGSAADPGTDGNAYWNNTSGTRSNADDIGTTNAANGVAPYVNTLDVILTADPYVLKASNDYRLNATAGGGAACRGFGVPTTWLGNSLTVSAPDMGAVQHVDSGGGGTTIFSGEF
jgi:hypothetical protein